MSPCYLVKTGEKFRFLRCWWPTKTPCAQVFQASWSVFPAELQIRFPDASALATLGAENYLSVVIVNAQGQAIGNLGIIDTKPLTEALPIAKSILQLCAARVGTEMERYANETALQDYADRQTLLNQLGNQIRHSLDLDTVLATTLA